MRVSTNYILELQQQGNLKKFATFIYMKALFKNSCVFKYNIKSLAKKSKLSRHIVRKNINFFLEQGWCKIHCGNLIFTKYSRTPQVEKEWIIRKKDIFIGKSIKEITTLLLSLVLKQEQNQFNWIQEIKHDLEKSRTSEWISPKDYKKAIKAQKKYGIKSGESENFKISIHKISLMFNTSKATVCNILKQMQRMKLVRVIGYYPEYIGQCTAQMWKSVCDTPGLIWLSHKNMAFIKKCNEYEFL